MKRSLQTWFVLPFCFAYWEPTTGNDVIVRTYDPAPGFYAQRMDFAPDGTLYLMDEDEALYSLDKQTGDYTLPGTVDELVGGPDGGTGDMAFAPVAHCTL